MKKLMWVLALVVSTSVLAGCVVDDRHGRRRGGYEQRDAWDIVQSDPCRRREYDEFAREHKNPDKRRRFAEQLARDGCSRPRTRDDRYDDPNYDPYRR